MVYNPVSKTLSQEIYQLEIPLRKMLEDEKKAEDK